MSRASSPLFVDREHPLAVLQHARERARGGSAGLVLIGGEAGAGKTRLLAECARHAANEGMLAVRGECMALSGGPVPYIAMTEALVALGRPELGDLLAHTSASAERAAPASQARLFEQIAEAIAAAAADQPIVVAIDDLHWADPSTLDLLGFLARRLDGARVLAVATFRAEAVAEEGDLGSWLGEVGRVAAVERLDLEPLSESDSEAVITAILGAAPDARLARAVVRRAGGNPFFIEELVAAPRSGELPSSLRDVLAARLARLDDGARAAARLAAVAGERIDDELLERVAGDGDLGASLRSLVADHVLATDAVGRLRFRHALVREAAYDELLPAERHDLHRRFAKALAGAGGVAAAVERAHHWYAAGAAEQALASAVAASAAAESVYATHEAHRLLERAIELWGKVPQAAELAGMDRAALLEHTAELAQRHGAYARAVELYDSAAAALDTADDPVRVGLILSKRARRSWWAGQGGAATFTAHERALALVPDIPPSAARARVLAEYAMSLALAARGGEAWEPASRAIELARVTGARREESCALNAVGIIKGDVDSLEESVAIAREGGYGEELGDAATDLSGLLLVLGRFDDAVQRAREGIEDCRRLGVEDMWGHFIAGNLVEALLALGRWDEAERCLAEHLRAPGLSPVDASTLHLDATDLALRRGDAARAAAELATARRLGPPASYGAGFRVDLARLEAEILLARGRLQEAWTTVLEAVHLTASSENVWNCLTLPRVAAEVAAELAQRERARGDADAARAIVAELEALPVEPLRTASAARLVTAERSAAAAERSRAGGRNDPTAWRLAAESWDGLQMPYEAARARWRLAEAILATGATRAEAAVPLRAAAAEARRLGAAALLGHLEALAARARIELLAAAPPDEPMAETDPFDLTPREHEVLALLARGFTNRVIASELFISPKTAGAHVTSILRKLDAHTRGQAVARARSAGVLHDAHADPP